MGVTRTAPPPQVFRHSAEALIATQLATGRARDAIVMARRLRDQDVYNEAAGDS
jgi:hypothetical protein